MILLWAAFICLCASATGNEITYQTSFIAGPFTGMLRRRDYISGAGKKEKRLGSIFCVDQSGNVLEKCTHPTYKDHRVILQLDAYNYEIPAHRTPQRLQWRPVTNYDQTLAFAVVIAPNKCSVHSPSLSSKRHYNIRCPHPENKNNGLRINRDVAPRIPFFESKPKLIIPVYELTGAESNAATIASVSLVTSPLGTNFVTDFSFKPPTATLDAITPLHICLGVDDYRLPIATRCPTAVQPLSSFRLSENQEKEVTIGGVRFLCHAEMAPRFCIREHKIRANVKATVRDGIVKMKVRPYQHKGVRSFQPDVTIVNVT